MISDGTRHKDTSAPAHAIRRARSEQRLRNAHVLNGVRAGAAAALALAFFAATRLGASEWSGADAVCAIWSVLAAAVAIAGLRWRAVAVRSGLAFPLLDVVGIVAVELAVLPAMSDPPRVVAMATAPLALLVVGSTFWLERWLIWLTAGLAAAAQGALMVRYGAGAVAVGVTALSLVVMAAVTAYGASRIHALNESTTKYVTDLQLVEEAFRDLITHSPDGIVVHRDGEVLYANTQLAALLQVANIQAVRARGAGALVHPDDRPRFERRVAAVAHEGVPSEPAELRLAGEGGRVIPAEVRDVPIQFGDQQAVLTVVRDLTGLKQMQERLFVADRMASMGTLAAGVAHEINNPLTAVVGHVDLLEAELATAGSGADDERLRAALVEAMPDLREGLTRVRDIVRDLNVFSRSRDATDGVADVRKVLDSSLRMAANEIRHRARLEREFHDVPPVRASEARLGQVFLNLAVNAAQSIPEGNAERHVIRVVARPGPDSGVVVEFSDTGSGMTPELRRRIFDPFFTTKPAGVGTGLGLAICERIVTEVGGTITVESEVGRGSTFRINLPAAHAAPSPVVTPAAAAAPEVRRARILVVDDEALVAQMIERILSRQHEVHALTDAAEALRRIDAGERFDLILCDLMMPHVTGMDLHAEIRMRSQAQADRMIFLTGGAFTERAQAFLRDAPNLRLDKPFDAATLRVLVAHAVS